MKRITKFLFLILSILILSTSFISATFDPGLTETGGAGYRILERTESLDLDFDISYYRDRSETYLSGISYSQRVSVLEVPSSTNAKIISYPHISGHRWSMTKLKDIATKFENDNPDWRIIAAVNSDFYDINGNMNFPYQTNNSMVSEGEYYKTINRSGNGSIGFKNDGSTTPLAVVSSSPTRTQYMKLAVYDENDQIINEFNIEKLNTAPGTNETSVYFGVYNDSKVYVAKSVVVGSSDAYYVQNADLALPNSATDFYGKGTISSTAPVTINFGQFAIVTNNSEVSDALSIGVKIRAQYEFTGVMASATSITGYQGHYLQNFESATTNRTDLSARHPRTTVGVKPDGTIVMAVIDGRQAAYGMNGVHGTEMAAIMKKYGCVDAYNLDGGGSSRMIIRKDGEFVDGNTPSENRSVSSILLIAIQSPEIQIGFSASSDSITVNAELINKRQLDIQQLFVELNGELKEIVNNQAVFANLAGNTEYYYRFSYRDSKGKMNKILIDGKTRSLKQLPQNIRILISEDLFVFDLTIVYDDPDNASMLQIANVTFNNRSSKFFNNKIIFMKSQVGESIDDITIDFRYNLNEGEKISVLFNVPYELTSSVELDVISVIFIQHNTIIKSIYE